MVGLLDRDLPKKWLLDLKTFVSIETLVNLGSLSILRPSFRLLDFFDTSPFIDQKPS